MSEEAPAYALLLMVGIAFLLFSILCFWAAIQTVSAAPLLAAIPSATLSFLGFRGAYLLRRGEL